MAILGVCAIMACHARRGVTMHSVGGDGGWASGEVDPDEDDYPSSGGSNGDDFGADDY